MSDTEVLGTLRNSILRITRRRVIQTSVLLAVPGIHSAAAQDATPEATPATSPVAVTGTIRVSPMPGTVVASPRTQISFRGVAIDDVGPVAVQGEVSGWHAGTLIEHSDGNGASWVPDFAFLPGEKVSVRTRMNLTGTQNGDFIFTCFIPAEVHVEPIPSIEPDETQAHFYKSRAIKPTIVTATRTDAVGELAPGYYFISPKRGPGTNGALIVDETGEPIYFAQTPSQIEHTYDFKVIIYKGEPHLIWWQGYGLRGQGIGHWVITNNAYETVAYVQSGNALTGNDLHDVFVTDHGTAVIGIYECIRWDLSEYGGTGDDPYFDCILQEVDLENGAVWWEWHSTDHVPFDQSFVAPAFHEDSGAYDPFHWNSVQMLEDGSLIVSARNSCAVYKLDAVTGEIVWMLGGKASSFEQDEDSLTHWQHDARLHADGTISIFDNASSPSYRDHSRAMVFELDMDAMTAKVQRSIEHPDGILADSQGNFQILEGGNQIIGWGRQPRASEFSAEDELLLDLAYPKDRESYRAYKFEWTGKPSDSPALAVETLDNGEVSIAVSWNGATEVAAWQIVGGDSENSLDELGKPVGKTGFETELTLEEAPGYVAVVALDADGTVLGRSRAVATVDL
jgi:hypothetical protein